MAGNARFHDKFHSTNHHTLSTSGFPDSATDPIASPEKPFKGDFVVNGTLSASSGIKILSADIDKNVICENIIVENVVYTDFLSGNGTEVVISDGSLSGNGNFTLTLDFQTGVYINTPVTYISNNLSANNVLYSKDISISNNLSGSGIRITADANVGGNVIVTGNLSAANSRIIGNLITNTATITSLNITSNLTSNNATLSSLNVLTNLSGVTANLSSLNLTNNLNASIATLSTLNVTSNATITGNLLVFGNLSSLGDLTVLETNIVTTSSLSVTNNGNVNALTIRQNVSSFPIAQFNNNNTNIIVISSNGMTVNGIISANNTITSPNITNIQNNSASWVQATSFIQSGSSFVTAISSTSGSWLTGNTSLNFVCSTANIGSSLTAKDIRYTQSSYVSVSSYGTSSDVYLLKTSNTYQFLSCLNPISLYLPSLISSDTGLSFVVKNNSSLNHDITVKNSASATIVTIPHNSTNYRTFIASNNNWLFI